MKSNGREFGFSSYLRELFTGPEPVVSYLCRSYQVHNIPVGDRRAYENLGVIRERYGTLFNYFFAGQCGTQKWKPK